MSFLWQAGLKLLIFSRLASWLLGKIFQHSFKFCLWWIWKPGNTWGTQWCGKTQAHFILRTENWDFTFRQTCSSHYTGKGTSASGPRVPNFSLKMRLSVLLEILERAVPGRASNLHSSPAPAPSEVPPQQLLLCAQHRGSGPQQPSRSRSGGSALSDPITGMGRVADSNSS